MLSSSPPTIPQPPYRLQFFKPFVDWAIFPIHWRAQVLGLPRPGSVIFRFLHSKPSESISQNSASIEPKHEVVGKADEVGYLKSIVEEVGWLDWDEYLYLEVAEQSPWGSESEMVLYRWVDEPNRLQQELSFLNNLMEEDRIKLFAPVMRKVIQRFLLEVDMRKAYRAIVEKRYRNFFSSGRTLNFGRSDLEQDERELEEKSDGEKTEMLDSEIKPVV